MAEDHVAGRDTASEPYSWRRVRVLAGRVPRLLSALVAITFGAFIARAAGSGTGVIAVMAVVLAALNGYSKAHSP